MTSAAGGERGPFWWIPDGAELVCFFLISFHLKRFSLCQGKRKKHRGGRGGYLLVFVLISNKGRGTPAAAALAHPPVSGSVPKNQARSNHQSQEETTAVTPLRCGQQRPVSCNDSSKQQDEGVLQRPNVSVGDDHQRLGLGIQTARWVVLLLTQGDRISLVQISYLG